jgi:hypothetical protein
MFKLPPQHHPYWERKVAAFFAGKAQVVSRDDKREGVMINLGSNPVTISGG